MAATVLLVLLIVVASFMTTVEINRLEKDTSCERLAEEAADIAQNVETLIANDREQLEMVATVFARFDDLSPKDFQDILDAYEAVGTLSRLELLLPGDVLLTRGGRQVNASGYLSFQEAAARGAHISDRLEDFVTGSGYVVHHYVPIVRDGETIAVLCGVVELNRLPEVLDFTPYGGQAALYVIDGATGNFLLDTWHGGNGNIWELGERPMADGYDADAMRQGLIDGASNYVVFVSETTGSYLYFYYMPLHINEWRLALSVPEAAVFANANHVRTILNTLLAFEVLAFILYFLWTLRYVQRETGEKQRQLESLNTLYQVERLLFNAHERQENILRSLEEVGRMLSAQCVIFWMLEPSERRGAFTWEASPGLLPPRTPEEQLLVARRMAQRFQEGEEQLMAYSARALQSILELSPGSPIYAAAAVPVREMDGTLCGILAACNMPRRDTNLSLLKGVTFSFSLLCRNTRTHQAIKEQGERDALTGLYNRNRYEMDLPAYPNRFKNSLACIYMDVNGLHELNNSAGHDAGDRMLKTAAAWFQAVFGDPYAYRIGGDEFLAFSLDIAEAEVLRMAQEVEGALADEGYHVSIGVQWQREVPSVSRLIRAAEEKMYAQKRAYYQDARHDRRQRPAGS